MAKQDKITLTLGQQQELNMTQEEFDKLDEKKQKELIDKVNIALANFQRKIKKDQHDIGDFLVDELESPNQQIPKDIKKQITYSPEDIGAFIDKYKEEENLPDITEMVELIEIIDEANQELSSTTRIIQEMEKEMITADPEFYLNKYAQSLLDDAKFQDEIKTQAGFNKDDLIVKEPPHLLKSEELFTYIENTKNIMEEKNDLENFKLYLKTTDIYKNLVKRYLDIVNKNKRLRGIDFEDQKNVNKLITELTAMSERIDPDVKLDDPELTKNEKLLLHLQKEANFDNLKNPYKQILFTAKDRGRIKKLLQDYSLADIVAHARANTKEDLSLLLKESKKFLGKK